MPTRHDENTNGIPRWSAPWAAGWSAMSDISRIETDPQNFHGNRSASQRPNPVRRARALRALAGVLTVGLVAATLLL